MSIQVQSKDPAARRAALVELLRRGPASVVGDIPPTDFHMAADLILHGLDSTAEHALGHLERAEPMFQSPRTVPVMTAMFLRLLEAQFKGFGEDLLEQAREGLLRAGGAEALVEAEAEVAKFHKKG